MDGAMKQDRAPGILSVVEDISEALNRLDAQIDQLINRINPVLDPEAKVTNGNDPTPQLEIRLNSSIVQDLKAILNRTHSMADRVSELTTRVEL